MKKELHELKQLPQGWEWYRNAANMWMAKNDDDESFYTLNDRTCWDTGINPIPVDVVIAVLHANGFIG